MVNGNSGSIGGLAGSNDSPSYSFDMPPIAVCITHCYSASDVSGSSEVGGLVGYNSQSVAQCYSTGRVSGEAYIGGFVGRNFYHADIANCYATGRATGKRNVGGLVGENQCIFSLVGEIRNCYSTGGVVSSSPYSGGLVGRNCRDVGFSFWDVQTSGKAESAGGTGKITAEMQIASTFLEAGWDFVGETANGTEDIWWIDEGKDYPRLWWEAPAIDDR